LQVNERGQFNIREMLEAGASRNHFSSVSKDRLLFVVTVIEGAEIQGAMLSRAHLVCPCRGV
jgi:hypothetical protein